MRGKMCSVQVVQTLQGSQCLLRRVLRKLGLLTLLKVQDMPEGYYLYATLLAVLLPSALSLLSYLAPNSSARKPSAPRKLKAK